MVIDTAEDAMKMAALYATDHRELLFTTFNLNHGGEFRPEGTDMARHFWENLREIRLLNHTILITYDLPSCQIMWDIGIPCFLDRWLPQPDTLPGACSRLCSSLLNLNLFLLIPS